MTIRVRGPDAASTIRVYVEDRLFGLVLRRSKAVVHVGLRRRAHDGRYTARWPSGRERTYPTATMALDALLFDAALWTWDGWV